MPPSVDDYKDYTDAVVAAIGSKASPRVKHAFPILIRHLHAAVSPAWRSLTRDTIRRHRRLLLRPSLPHLHHVPHALDTPIATWIRF